MSIKRHLAKVAQLPCCLCGTMPVELHHIREGQGMAQRAPDTLVIPLCPDCHRGKNGIHGDKTMLRVMKKTELELLDETLRKVL